MIGAKLNVVSQAEFARYFCIGPSQLTNWIKGTQDTSPEMIPHTFERAVALRYGFAPTPEHFLVDQAGGALSREAWEGWFHNNWTGWRFGNSQDLRGNFEDALARGPLQVHSSEDPQLQVYLQALKTTRRPRGRALRSAGMDATYPYVPAEDAEAIRRAGKDYDVNNAQKLRDAIIACTPFLALSGRHGLVELVTQAVSKHKPSRRNAHLSIMSASDSVREAFLLVMGALAEHDDQGVRGEAIYCLGTVLLPNGRYALSCEQLCRHLRDQSMFVRCCAANVARNLVPLSDTVVDQLTDMLLLRRAELSQNTMLSNLTYYSSVALWADLAFKKRAEA